jgi:hypothetical protein
VFAYKLWDVWLHVLNTTLSGGVKPNAAKYLSISFSSLYFSRLSYFENG